MANKTNNTNADEKKTNLPNELFQLRDILFGEDKREFEAHFQELEKQTNKQIDQLSTSLHNELEELRQSMDKSFSLLSERINDTDHLHSEREDEIKQFADSTADRLEAFEQESQKVTQDVLTKMNAESSAINTKFNQQIQDALDKLQKVSDALQSNKADRQLLAELLTSAAEKINAADS